MQSPTVQDILPDLINQLYAGVTGTYIYAQTMQCWPCQKGHAVYVLITRELKAQ